MLEDAKPKLLIATNEQLARFSDIPGLESLCYDSPCQQKMLLRWRYLSPIILPISFLLPVLPVDQKVMVGQTAIVNRLLWMQNHYSLTADDVVAQKTPCSFDVSVWEFSGRLLPGQSW